MGKVSWLKEVVGRGGTRWRHADAHWKTTMPFAFQAAESMLGAAARLSGCDGEVHRPRMSSTASPTTREGAARKKLEGELGRERFGEEGDQCGRERGEVWEREEEEGFFFKRDYTLSYDMWVQVVTSATDTRLSHIRTCDELLMK